LNGSSGNTFRDDAKTDGDIVFYSRDGGKVTVSKERWRGVSAGIL